MKSDVILSFLVGLKQYFFIITIIMNIAGVEWQPATSSLASRKAIGEHLRLLSKVPDFGCESRVSWPPGRMEVVVSDCSACVAGIRVACF